jgi:hypothetical protein
VSDSQLLFLKALASILEPIRIGEAKFRCNLLYPNQSDPQLMTEAPAKACAACERPVRARLAVWDRKEMEPILVLAGTALTLGKTMTTEEEDVRTSPIPSSRQSVVIWQSCAQGPRCGPRPRLGSHPCKHPVSLRNDGSTYYFPVHGVGSRSRHSELRFVERCNALC